MAGFELGTFSIGSLIGLGLGAFLGHALAIRRSKNLTKHNAAIELKKVLIPVLDILENNGNQFETVKESFDRHYSAAIDFSIYLSGKELQSFKYAIANYKQWKNIMCGRSLEEMLYETNDPEFLKARAIKPATLITALLVFTNT
jgi:hypothetical protein